ncbi:MAG: hypothetical protein IPO22_22270 [Anaerolineales bacterium]|nr:hypothetical protein [Anaerolineales bacterium]
MFEILPSSGNTYSNAIQDKPFDQIAFLAREIQTQMGVAKPVPFFEHVYRGSDWRTYQPQMTLNQYKQWRTFKMSDHLPLWS